MENEYVYLVIFNGWRGGYGIDLYCLGIYSTEDKARDAIDEHLFKAECPDDIEAEIHKVQFDTTYEPHINRMGNDVSLSSLFPIGSYIE